MYSHIALKFIFLFGIIKNGECVINPKTLNVMVMEGFLSVFDEEVRNYIRHSEYL